MVARLAHGDTGIVPMEQLYGKFICNGSRISGFMEKGFPGQGDINGGVYIVEKKVCSHFPLTSEFSFEKDFLEKNKLVFTGVISNSYFIDIGIPVDYNRANMELPIQMRKG